MQKSAQDTQVACANAKCTQERQDKHIELYKYLNIIIIIIINIINTPRRVQRYGYNRNYNTTADTIASSSLWLK